MSGVWVHLLQIAALKRITADTPKQGSRQIDALKNGIGSAGSHPEPSEVISIHDVDVARLAPHHGNPTDTPTVERVWVQQSHLRRPDVPITTIKRVEIIRLEPVRLFESP